MTLKVKTKRGGNITGTAFLAIKDGCAVTAWHVVEDAESVVARFSDGQEFDVSGLIDKNEKRDVALVRVNVSGRPLLHLAKATPTVGSKVFVIGAPLGLDFSFTDGIISQVRSDGPATLYQFSAETNPGNSGGPLLNLDSDVLGVVSWKLRDTQNVNFAAAYNSIAPLDSSKTVQPWPAPSEVRSSPASPVSAHQLHARMLSKITEADIMMQKAIRHMEGLNWKSETAIEEFARAAGKLQAALGSVLDEINATRVPLPSSYFSRLGAINSTLGDYLNTELATARTVLALTPDKRSELKRALEGRIDAGLRYAAALTEFAQVFGFADFHEHLSPPVMFYWLNGLQEPPYADPAFPDSARVLFDYFQSFQPNDVVIAIKPSSADTFSQVSSWSDVVKMVMSLRVAGSKDEVVFKVKRGDQTIEVRLPIRALD
jgi:hypothetical protein